MTGDFGAGLGFGFPHWPQSPTTFQSELPNRELWEDHSQKGRFGIIDIIFKIAIMWIMGAKYTTSPHASLKVNELPAVTATALKNSTSDVLDQVSAEGAVAITKHNKPRAILISVAQYEGMRGTESNLLNELQAEYRGMLEKMQEPEQKAAAKRLFEATPEELGAAAVRAAQRNGNQSA